MRENARKAKKPTGVWKGMDDKETATETRTLSVPPEREQLVLSCYEKLGYQTESVVRDEHGDTKITFCLQDADAFDPERAARVDAIFAELFAIDRQVMLYYLKRVCLVGLIGAACIGLSFSALHFHVHWLFTVLLLIGIFGCTITLSLRPLFTRMGMRQYGETEPALLAELNALLHLDGGDAA